jgi:hypothetical protein
VGFESWRALYASDLQGLYALVAVPALFLLTLAAAAVRRTPTAPGDAATPAPAGARFVRAYAACFAVETIADPLAGGPLLRWLGLAEGPAATAVMLAFVLLGDFRVFLLVLGLAAAGSKTAAPRALGRAAAEAVLWTLVVPVAAGLAHAGARALAGDLPAQSLWLVYELGFAAMALYLRAAVVPARVPAAAPGLRAYLRAVTAYVAVYYALWAAADVLILLGVDAGWGLRVAPNQLYYAWFVPVAYARFFSRRYASTSSATQASR